MKSCEVEAHPSLAAHLPWAQGVGSSNLAAPTNDFNQLQAEDFHGRIGL